MKINKKKSRPMGWVLLVALAAAVSLGLYLYSHHTSQTKPPIATVSLQGTIQEQKFISPWLQSAQIPIKSQKKLFADIRADSSSSNQLWLNQAALLYPTIEQLCLKDNLDPLIVTGLIIQESQGNPLAVDYAFATGISNHTHIGLGQLSSSRIAALLPGIHKQQLAKRLKLIAHLAYQWRSHRKEVSAKLFLSKWAAVDPRFDALSNLTQTIKEFKAHQKLSGDVTLAIMAHHGGTYDPLNRVAGYRHYVDPSHPAVSTRNVAQYVQAHHLNYFILAESKDRGANYWSAKGDGHLTYCYSVLAWSEVFCRFLATPTKDLQQAVKKYNGEVPYLVAHQDEHTLWWRGKPYYQNVSDLKRAKAAGNLVSAPSTLTTDGLVLTPVGQKDPANSKLYALANQQVWQTMEEVSRRSRARSVHPKTYRIESLVRTVSYCKLMGRGALTTSHNFGAAFDISLKQDAASLTCLHRTLYEMAQEGKLAYYMESNTSYAGKLATFPTPYNFTKGGQIHVFVNPYEKADEAH